MFFSDPYELQPPISSEITAGTPHCRAVETSDKAKYFALFQLELFLAKLHANIHLPPQNPVNTNWATKWWWETKVKGACRE